MGSEEARDARPGMFHHLREPANLVTVAGLVAAGMAVASALQGRYSASVVLALWAFLGDWYDGLLAQRGKERDGTFRAYGAQLDGFVDLVSFGVWPGIFLFSYAHFSTWYIPGLLAPIVAGVVRLSYFAVHGLDRRGGRAWYTGLSMDWLTLFIGVAFLFHPFLSHRAMSVLLYAGIGTLCALMVSSWRTPKLGKAWYVVQTAVVVALTGLYAAMPR